MSKRFVERGGWWLVTQTILMLAVAALGFVCVPETRHLSLIVIGLVFHAISAGCAIAGAMALGRNLTPFPKPPAGAQLVQHGIYRLIRHPLYLALICAAVGWSLIRSSWPAIAASVVLAVFFDAKARREERWMRRQFPDYARYEQRVRRFIPWIY
jgi:protein-S-isoprenylcysteine O-methyltransferase Ste14